jgi:ketosteroid isomerase-like protein
VSDLLTAAAKTLNYTSWSAENLVTSFSDTLGFTVELERLTRQIDGETETMSLRATSVYRREAGAWRVIHRHGDSLMTVEIDPEGRR